MKDKENQPPAQAQFARVCVIQSEAHISSCIWTVIVHYFVQTQTWYIMKYDINLLTYALKKPRLRVPLALRLPALKFQGIFLVWAWRSGEVGSLIQFKMLCFFLCSEWVTISEQWAPKQTVKWRHILCALVTPHWPRSSLHNCLLSHKHLLANMTPSRW